MMETSQQDWAWVGAANRQRILEAHDLLYRLFAELEQAARHVDHTVPVDWYGIAGMVFGIRGTLDRLYVAACELQSYQDDEAHSIASATTIGVVAEGEEATHGS